MLNPTFTPDNNRGFTIIELMLAVTVLAVLLGVGVPAFTEIVRNNRTAAQANELITALNLARSEASKRGLAMSVCAANAAQTGCAGPNATDWANGWLVFSDQTGVAGAIDGADVLVQRSRAVDDRLNLNSGGAGFVRFGANGAPTVAAAFTLEHEDCSGNNLRRIGINPVGRISLTKEACT